APIARLNANGSLDTTFNSGTGPGSVVQSLLLQPDGKIVIAGAILNGGTKRLARLNANGSLDTTFSAALPYTNLAVGALALQPDGKVFVGMDFSNNANPELVNRIFRLNPDGQLDSTFPQHESGIELQEGPVSTVDALLMQPDGKLIVGGAFDVVDG